VKSYHDIAHDGGSGVHAQIEEQQSKIARSLSGVRRILAVGSGKGGVGKSTLALQLAGALRERGLDLAVLDADLNGPCQARLAGLRGATAFPGPRGLVMPRTPSGIGVVSIGSFLPDAHALDFDSVAGGASHLWRATREFAMLGEILGTVEWGALDCLILDLPPGAERTTQYAEFFGERAAFVLVTVPSDVARDVVARSAAALRKASARVLGYIENMKGYCCAECGKIRPLFAESGDVDLGVPCLGGVPFDPELARACDEGRALPTDLPGPTRSAIHDVAENVYSALEAA
jgi:ATP-binding protein involved in chromosome partitioning